MTNPSPLLSVNNFSVSFKNSPKNCTPVVHGINFKIYPNEKLALVGESGSGKSVTALSILQLHDRQHVTYPSGEIDFQGSDLLQLSETRLRGLRGKEIAMIFQEPMTSLNPVYPIGTQLVEPLLLHERLSKSKARRQMIELLERTGIPEPHKRFDAFPHTLSGGQRQRVMIAMALACRPKLLIADEPTTALDVTIQLQILELLENIQKEFGMAVLLITHDLNMVKRFAERICVMQNGSLVESETVKKLFEQPQHPYTQHLLNSQPERIVTDYNYSATKAPLLKGKQISCHFPLKQGVLFKRTVDKIKAVDEESLQLYSGETVGIVGESGSGKTTLGLCLLRLQKCSGEIYFAGKRLDTLHTSELRSQRRHFQVVFQDPYSSLSPRMTVEQIIGEGLIIHFPELNRSQRRERIVKILTEVGLQEDMLERYPYQFSGGQRQRIAIARVVILEPQLILLDEPTSALDVSVQKQVLELLKNLQKKHRISYLFISHDLKVIRAMSHRIIVMHHGKFIEQGKTKQLFNFPQHAYTKTLLHASLG
ncbi:ABC transporter ATP-binding protein [Candidatus Parabeggiatoa sp. HSG14]|uniref:ABC transporter ATP-binding protein n=1 Tax=Candidatus Parabeggiatoa sp. HSG14 TaxID=3055593 RepID=UPI0025A81E9E|nr:ABC transporter ATP-binding protein [Thiotrichales bacterium HSG14]